MYSHGAFFKSTLRPPVMLTFSWIVQIHLRVPLQIAPREYIIYVRTRIYDIYITRQDAGTSEEVPGTAVHNCFVVLLYNRQYIFVRGSMLYSLLLYSLRRKRCTCAQTTTGSTRQQAKAPYSLLTSGVPVYIACPATNTRDSSLRTWKVRAVQPTYFEVHV